MPADPRMTKSALRPLKIYDAIMGWMRDKRDKAQDRMQPGERAVSEFAGKAVDKGKSLIDKLTGN